MGAILILKILPILYISKKEDSDRIQGITIVSKDLLTLLGV